MLLKLPALSGKSDWKLTEVTVNANVTTVVCGPNPMRWGIEFGVNIGSVVVTWQSVNAANVAFWRPITPADPSVFYKYSDYLNVVGTTWFAFNTGPPCIVQVREILWKG